MHVYNPYLVVIYGHKKYKKVYIEESDTNKLPLGVIVQFTGIGYVKCHHIKRSYPQPTIYVDYVGDYLPDNSPIDVLSWVNAQGNIKTISFLDACGAVTKAIVNIDM